MKNDKEIKVSVLKDILKFFSNRHRQNLEERNIYFCFFADKVTSNSAEVTHEGRNNIQVAV